MSRQRRRGRLPSAWRARRATRHRPTQRGNGSRAADLTSGPARARARGSRPRAGCRDTCCRNAAARADASAARPSSDQRLDGEPLALLLQQPAGNRRRHSVEHAQRACGVAVAQRLAAPPLINVVSPRRRAAGDGTVGDGPAAAAASQLRCAAGRAARRAAGRAGAGGGASPRRTALSGGRRRRGRCRRRLRDGSGRDGNAGGRGPFAAPMADSLPSATSAGGAPPARRRPRRSSRGRWSPSPPAPGRRRWSSSTSSGTRRPHPPTAAYTDRARPAPARRAPGVARRRDVGAVAQQLRWLSGQPRSASEAHGILRRCSCAPPPPRRALRLVRRIPPARRRAALNATRARRRRE